MVYIEDKARDERPCKLSDYSSNVDCYHVDILEAIECRAHHIPHSVERNQKASSCLVCTDNRGEAMGGGIDDPRATELRR